MVGTELSSRPCCHLHSLWRSADNALKESIAISGQEPLPQSHQMVLKAREARDAHP